MCAKDYRSDFKRYKEYPLNFTCEQEDILNGNMLGDGCIPYMKKSRYNCFSFEQCKTRGEYVKWVFGKLYPFTDRSKIRIIIHDKRKWNKGIYEGVQFRTTSHPLFKELREKWYSEDIPYAEKIVPSDLKLNWRTVAYWHADDGAIRKNKKEIILCSQSFSKGCNEFLVSLFERDLNIKATLNRRDNNKFLIRISSYDYFNFIDGIKPYLKDISCIAYKTDTSNISKATNPIYMKSHINLVLNLWETGNYTQVQLAKIIGCHKQTIYRWIKNGK